MLNHEFKFQMSRYYFGLMSALILFSILIVANLPLNLVIKIILFLFIFSYGGFIFWHFIFLRSQQSILALKNIADGTFLLLTPNKTYRATLLGDSIVTPFVAILRFKIEQHRFAKVCVIFRDSVSTADYQKLVMVLRMF